MKFKFLNKAKIISTDLFGQSFEYLVQKYGQSVNLLTPSSPFTQILYVLTEISELIFYYIEASISELNILTAKNSNSIRGLSRLTGHDATRGISSIGKISLKINPSADLEATLFNVKRYTKLTCLNNSLSYFLDFDSESLLFSKGDNEYKYANIVQGQIDEQVRISKGYMYESFSIDTEEMSDHFNITVTVNGEQWKKYESLLDMQSDTKGYIIKTGISGGLDIYFGDDEMGLIPDKGSNIKIQYIKTNGSSGNLNTNSNATFQFNSYGISEKGEDIDLNDSLILNVIMPPIMGSDKESTELTKLLSPHTSKSFLLARPENYIYFLRRYNYFSTIRAFNTFDDENLDDDNIIYLYLLPDIKQKVSSDVDYFDLNEDEFTLSENQKSHITQLFEESKQQFASSEIVYVNPVKKYYAINIILTYFDNVKKEDISNLIRYNLSEYFLTINRHDKIPKSDLIAIIENIEGVDSVNLQFISKENEEAISNGYYMKPIYKTNGNTSVLLETKKITLNTGENPNIGLDNFGDIIMNNKELVIIKGGWKDRNGKYYEVNPSENNISSLNIIFKGTTKYDLFTQINNSNFKKITNK